MKIKRNPEDFCVDERTEFAVGMRGEFAVYRLTKQGLGTPEAVDAVLRRWKLPRKNLSYGGLKDRHAVTSQHLTVFRGPRRNLEQTNLQLEYLGQAERHFEPKDISGNAFQLVIRDLAAAETAQAETALREVAACGLPNYFDDQRFGSVTTEGEFIGAAWVRDDYERCLWLALAAPTSADRSSEKEQKRILRDHWGRWSECQPLLERSHRRSIVTYLRDHPTRWRDAWSLVRTDMRGLYLSAFQSSLWNQLAARCIAAAVPENAPASAGPLHTVEIGGVALPFWSVLADAAVTQLESVLLPLPCARQKLEEHPLRELVESTLVELGHPLNSLKIKHHRDSFFSKGERAVLVRPKDLSWMSGEDDLHAEKRLLKLHFELPRGSYATVLVKRITLRPGAA